MMKKYAAVILVLMTIPALFVKAQPGKPAPAPVAATKAKPKPKEIAPAVQIYFDFNKAAIKKAEEEKLSKLLEDLKSKKEYKLVLTGHTDSTGNDDYNLELSQKRVDEVYDWMIEKGVDATIIERSYFGRAKPREKTELDEEKKSKNRRVEITIIEKEKPLPPPPPPVKDTCNYDTTVVLSQGVSITMNVCEFKRMCKNSAGKCITVNRLTETEEIFESGTPLKTQKGEGFMWGGIFEFKFPGDTCLKKPASFTTKLDLETYKKAKLNVYKAKGESYLELDKSIRVSQTKTKSDIKVTIPVKCPGAVNLCGTAGKSKATAFKDKSGKIQDIYVVTSEPATIIPAVKKGSKWFLNYNKVSDAKLYIRLTDGETVIKDIALSSVKKSKKPGELRKKYKIKAKHIKGS
jgi:outer membrane protein OmpA-like peptidoglycan-associated protein